MLNRDLLEPLIDPALAALLRHGVSAREIANLGRALEQRAGTALKRLDRACAAMESNPDQTELEDLLALRSALTGSYTPPTVFQIRCSAEWKERLEKAAVASGLSMAAIVTQAVDRWISEHK